MTFLYTAFLTALAAAGIPVLLHIFSRRRLPVIPFSSLRFLERLQQRKARRLQLRQLILLALRVLAVAVLVLVFARPALKTRGAAGSAAAVEMVILLDESLPTAAQSNDGRTVRLAARRAAELAALAGRNDRVTLLTATGIEPPLTAPPGGVGMVRSRLEETVSLPVAPDLVGALQRADSIFSASDRFNRELYIVSPFYGGDWDTLESTGAAARRTFLTPVGPRRLNNLSVDRVRVAGTILQRGQPVDVEITCSNHDDKDAVGVPLSIYLDDERTAQTTLDIPAGGSAARSLKVQPGRGGMIAGLATLDEPDPLLPDSRRYFILNVPDSLKVLVVAPDPLDSAVVRSVFSGDLTGFVNLRYADPGNWETGSLAGYDVLLLAGVASVSEGAAARVREFSAAGGGVVMFPARDADLAELTRGLWRRLGFAGARGVFQGGTVSWGRLDLSHPIFAGMFEKQGKPRSPQFNFTIDLAAGSGSQVVIPLSNRSPFLLERQVGRGRALLFAVPLSPGAGDLIYSGIFAPLLFRAVAYAVAAGDGGAAWVTGGRYREVLPLPRAEPARLKLPGGEMVDLPPRPVVGGVEYDFGMVLQPGIYELTSAGNLLTRHAANVPGGESSLVRTDLDQLTERLKARIIKSDTADLAAYVRSARYGRELWRPLTAVFLLLLVTESLLARLWSKERT